MASETILVAFREVEDALVAVRTAREQREAQEVQVEALQSALSLADKRYRAGLSGYLDVLTAQRNLFDAELGSPGPDGWNWCQSSSSTRLWAGAACEYPGGRKAYPSFSP